MGRRGPAKTPTALKILRGIPGGRSKLTKGEAKPEVINGTPPPQELSEDGKAIWRELAPRMEELGLLSVLDTNPFRRYCEMMGRWARASRKIQETGQTHVPIFHELTPEQRQRGEKPKLKYIQELPESLEFRRLPGELLRLEGQFGLTPASRAAISVLPKSKDAPSDIHAFLYSGKK